MAEVWRAFKVDLGIVGKEFVAVVVTDGKKGRPMPVLSTRFGPWAVERDVFLADLTQPEQRYIEWTVRDIDPKTVKVPHELLEQL